MQYHLAADEVLKALLPAVQKLADAIAQPEALTHGGTRRRFISSSFICFNLYFNPFYLFYLLKCINNIE